MTEELLKVDESSGIPIWVQLRNRLTYLISVGHYKPGEQLPTVRGLAAKININYNTVNKVYQSLERDGYIQTRRGLGTFVCDADTIGSAASESVSDMVTDEYLRKCLGLGMSFDDVSDQVTRRINKMKALGQKWKDDL